MALVLSTTESHEKFLVKDSTSVDGLGGEKRVLTFNKGLNS